MYNKCRDLNLATPVPITLPQITSSCLFPFVLWGGLIASRLDEIYASDKLVIAWCWSQLEVTCGRLLNDQFRPRVKMQRPTPRLISSFMGAHKGRADMETRPHSGATTRVPGLLFNGDKGALIS